MPKTGSAGYLTLRIPRPMAEVIEEFLRTDKAKRLGLDSKSDVVTAAVREFLEKHGMYEE
jgi:Arc/MetJ family transcription regulator